MANITDLLNKNKDERTPTTHQAVANELVNAQLWYYRDDSSMLRPVCEPWSNESLMPLFFSTEEQAKEYGKYTDLRLIDIPEGACDALLLWLKELGITQIGIDPNTPQSCVIKIDEIPLTIPDNVIDNSAFNRKLLSWYLKSIGNQDGFKMPAELRAELDETNCYMVLKDIPGEDELVSVQAFDLGYGEWPVVFTNTSEVGFFCCVHDMLDYKMLKIPFNMIMKIFNENDDPIEHVYIDPLSMRFMV